ncbi:ABC transporter substrate-binding protein/permease [Fructobacillus sp. M1-13]|uniref:ABC transporter substrate-binding protein/permease n=2 Tax=Fructobacillus papyriferae TaxID=2713171 RepID=A0ABS5QQA4_9LACO|nr:ABC transporter substrate-binding protein/permease [Fructobacillus papyriferae]MBS9335368.1 ABC transporter substrate-binding protein/permease [Fructobacillus papyriferae]MCD2158963.1 ABC transporter substrate-binding protein/permease [Fructobacillus papyriferae]
MVKKRIKPLLAALVALFFATFMAGTSVDAASKPNYVISTDATYAPFDFQDKNNQYVGIDMDILKEVAKRNNFTYTLKPMSFNAAAQMVANGQADGIIAGMMINDSRKEVYDVSTPYYQSGVAWITKPNSSIKSLDDLKGKTVALKTGTAAANYGASLKDKYGFKVKYFNDTDTMYNDVVNGNTAATFEDYPVIQYAIKNGVKLQVRNPKDLGNAGGVGFFVKKGENAQLLSQFNTTLAAMKKDGTYDKIINKYLNASQSTFVGSEKDNKTTWGILKSNQHAFWEGLLQTAILTIAGIVLASLWGLLLGIMGISEWKFLRGLSTTIIYAFRGLPLMVLAFFIYIGLPGVIGMKIPAFTAGLLTLILNEGAYTGAFVRGGFESVDVGQMEAARSLGLTHRQAIWKVIVPQGLKITVPSFVNQFIITLKDTSILSAIGILELTQTGTLIVARNSQGFRVWAIIAAIYLIVITLLTWFSNWLKKKIA